MNVRNLVLALGLLVLAPLACAAESAAPATGNSAEATVERLHGALIEAMQQGSGLGQAGRVKLLEPVIVECFDFETIASIVTARGWKSATEAQKRDFLRVFSDLSVATYASNFSGYDGEKFVTQGSEDSRGSRIVRTVLEKQDGEQIPLNYMLRESNGAWRIINVVAQGVSDLSLKRAEYTAVIQGEGFESLVQRLAQKVAEMRP